MKKFLEFIKYLFTSKKKSFVTIDEFGGSTFNVQAFLHTSEGKKMLDNMHEFFERNVGKSFYD